METAPTNRPAARVRTMRTALALVLVVTTVLAGRIPTAPDASADVAAGTMVFAEPTAHAQRPGFEFGLPTGNLDCGPGNRCIIVGPPDRIITGSDVDTAPPSSDWKSVVLPTTTTLTRATCATATRCIAVDNNGDTWWTADVTAPDNIWHPGGSILIGDATDLTCPTATTCIVTGSNGQVAVSQNAIGGTANWTASSISGMDMQTIVAIACPEMSFCLTTNATGHMAWTDDITATPVIWTTYEISLGGQVTDLACPTTTLCVATTDSGQILWTTMPATVFFGSWTTEYLMNWPALSSISCPTTTRCVAGSRSGAPVTTTDPTGPGHAWTTTDVAIDPANPGDPVDRVACSTATHCIGLRITGQGVMSHPVGGDLLWTDHQFSGWNRIVDADCPDDTFCVGVDGVGHIITMDDPAAPASWETWGLTVATEIACADPDLCIAVGSDYGASTDPAGGWRTWETWPGRPGGLDPYIPAVTCASPTFCIAIDQFDMVSVTSNPAGGPSTWSPGFDMRPGSTWAPRDISCPSASLCVVTLQNGLIGWSTNPGGGAAAWHWTDLTFGINNAVTDIECPSEDLCVGAAASGYITVSTNPTGGPDAWDTGYLGFHGPLSCPTNDWCVTSHDGRIATSTHPADGPTAWHESAQTFDDFDIVTTVECSSRSRCLLTAEPGYATLGTIPPPDTGMLRVTSTPAVPTRITIDGHPANTWGLQWVKLAPGDHDVCFSGIAGFTTPACETVTIVAGQTTTLDGVFAPRGYLKVTTSPAVASRITIDGNPADNWGVHTDLAPGSHTVCFGPVAGWNPPSCKTATVTAGQTTTVTGTFTVNAAAPGASGKGMLRVTTSPAVPSQISVDGHPADTWGLDWLELDPGSHSVCFGDVVGHATPACKNMTITAGQTTTTTGTFSPLGMLKVETSPPLPGTISIDGNPADDWGVYTDVTPGSHQVCFGDVAGWSGPACRNVTVTAGALATTVGTYG